MINYLPDLLKNPLILTGILMAFAVVIYFSLEYRHIIHKTKRERATILVSWGLLLLAIALISLFTTSLNMIVKSANLVPADFTQDAVTLDQADKICRNLIANPSSSENKFIQSCSLINQIFYGAYVLLGISLLLLIFGLVKRKKTTDPKTNGEPIKEEKHRIKKS